MANGKTDAKLNEPRKIYYTEQERPSDYDERMKKYGATSSTPDDKKLGETEASMDTLLGLVESLLNATSDKNKKDTNELTEEDAVERGDNDLMIAKKILENYQKGTELGDGDLELLMKNYIPLLQSSDKETNRLLNRLLGDKHRIPYDILGSTEASNDIFGSFKRKINNIGNEIRRVQLNNDGLKIMDDNLTREVNDPKLGSRKEYNFNDKDRKDLEKIEDELWNTYGLLPDKDYSHIMKEEIKKGTKKDQYRGR